MQALRRRPRAARRSSWTCTTGISWRWRPPRPSIRTLSCRGYRAADWQRITELRSREEPRHAGELPAGLHLQDGGGAGLPGSRAEPKHDDRQSRLHLSSATSAFARPRQARHLRFPPRAEASCNTYFITNGRACGRISNIVRLAQRLHLGERTGLPTRQEVAGIFPSLKTVSSGWHDGDTGNLCIGQGPMAVTPIQMAVLTAAIANGGKVLWPAPGGPHRTAGPDVGRAAELSSRRAGCGMNSASTRTTWRSCARRCWPTSKMPTARAVKAAVPGLRICGKTGTAQVKNEQKVRRD